MTQFQNVTNSSRQPAVVAGRFYPADRNELQLTMDSYFRAIPPMESKTIRALIVPHAGYIYSGKVAAKAYAVAKNNCNPSRIVILGPSHRLPFRGMAASSAEVFDTPIGGIEVDKSAVWAALRPPWTGYKDAAFHHEHSVDVHLPFIKHCFPQAKIFPIVVGDTPPAEVARLIEPHLKKDDTLVIVSSDLSHYHEYQEAYDIDILTTERICNLESDIKPEEACGCRIINGLTYAAKRLNQSIQCLELNNSGDTAGDRSRVVGYGSFTLTED